MKYKFFRGRLETSTLHGLAINGTTRAAVMLFNV